MSKPRLQDVAETIQAFVANLINAAGVTNLGQVIVGNPTGPDLGEIIAQADEEWQITVLPLDDARDMTRYQLMTFKLSSPSVPMSASVTGDTLTFAGAVIPGLNVHAFVGRLLRDAFYQTQSGDGLPQVAIGIQNAANALGIAGVSATASGDGVAITGSPLLRCNIGGQGLVEAKEVGRVCRSVQVSVWCPDPIIRWTLADIVLIGLGQGDSNDLPLSDGTPLRVFYENDMMRDKAQSSYSLYEHHIRLHAEYGIIKVLQGAQVESLEVQETVNGEGPFTTFGG